MPTRTSFLTVPHAGSPARHSNRAEGIALIVVSEGTKAVCLAMDLQGLNRGASITNSHEAVASWAMENVLAVQDIQPEDVLFIEMDSSGYFDRVAFTWTGHKASSPVWKPVLPTECRKDNRSLEAMLAAADEHGINPEELMRAFRAVLKQTAPIGLSSVLLIPVSSLA